MPARRDLLLALACGALPGVGAAAPLPVALRLERRVFGSPADLMLARRGDATAVAAGEAVFAALQRLNDRWNAWKPGELTALNAGLRAGRSVDVSPALAAAIRGAAALESASAGLFNPAIGRAIGGWGFHDDVLRPGSRPARSEHVRWQRQRPSLVQLEWQGSLLRSRNPWLQIDLGAYAKGIAADWALDRLRASGIDDALVNLGGNL
ncbi:MAG TPA: FAD:protein FMN transferase, partial [Burkholderiaceae bacterium]|nr:FAD:protein FMN transferase [Burkholderiaceae bacterium]